MRNPNLGSTPYLARYEIHQVIGLTDQTTSQEPNFFALATSVPVRRIEFRLGKMTLPDFFDINDIGSDSHLQFTNWTVDNNGAWDYAADTRGYTVGGMVEYDDRSWSLRYGIFAMPVVANGIDLDWAFSRAHGQNGEFELRRSFSGWPKRKGTTRAAVLRQHAPTWAAIARRSNAFLSGTDPTPNIVAHEHFGALKYGVGYNLQQELSDNLRVFGRFGWNEGQHESFAYTEVDQTVEVGGDYSGRRWHRNEDKFGLAVVSNAIKRDHQNYLHYGGVGISARRRQSQLRARKHRRKLLQLARLARPVLRHRRAAHRRSRLQPRPRPRVGGLGSRPYRLLSKTADLQGRVRYA